MKSTWKILAAIIGLYLVALIAIRPSTGTVYSNNLRAPSGQASIGGQTDDTNQPQMEGPLVSAPVPASLTIAVRDLPEAKAEAVLEHEINPRQNPLRDLLTTNISGPEDPLLPMAQLDNTTSFAPILTFEGTDNFCACSPPDIVGDVGPNHYVQMVNSTIMNIYNKNGTVLVANKNLNTLWSSGGCSTSAKGDPVVNYDGLANRWLLAQFSTGNGVCVAISQTADPTGAYYGYEFTTPSFPDYFKISVWPNGYYMSANESSYVAIVLDRAKMLLGQPASFIRFAGQTNLLMPADLDGPTAPPANAPGLFYTFKDDATASHGTGADRIELFALTPDWTTPANSTFTLINTFNIASFTYTVCGFFTLDCIPQGGTTQKVDPVSEWPMWRFAYRNFGDHQALVGNFTVDVGSDRAGIRWFELRNTSGTWSLFQQGTYSFADTVYRWMGSIAMDKDGNMALGYTRSSSSANPAIYYTTRLATDTAGTFGPEELLFAGSGSQTGSNRWGDYSSMNVDPSDDCTFWYTQEYYPSNSSNNWNTRIGKFKIASCGATASQPDLIVSSMKITLQNSGCFIPGTPLGVEVTVKNQGTANAAAFVVSLNGIQQTVAGGLAAGATTTVWFSGNTSGSQTAVADATNVITESNESNNSLTQTLPVPTPPVSCTATPVGTAVPPTNTPVPPTPTNTPVPPTATNTPGTGTCTTYASSDVPKAISASGTPSVSSILNIPSGGTITDINVLNLNGTHTWINDLDFTLKSPANTSVQIMARSCSSEDNFGLNLDDEAAAGAWPCPPVGGGTYRPSNLLSAFDGQTSTGTWTLTVRDNATSDGGSLNGWSLQVCTGGANPTNTPVPPTATNTPVPPTATNTPLPPTPTNTPSAPSCTTYASSDVPKAISASGTPTVTSVLSVPSGGTITDVNVVNLNGTHTWINDLDFKLTSPAATTIQIMARSCSSQDNFGLNLDDEAAPGAWPCPPVGGGTYRPSVALSGFDGQNSTGTWTLTVKDNANADGGSLNGWGIQICTSGFAPTTNNNDSVFQPVSLTRVPTQP